MDESREEREELERDVRDDENDAREHERMTDYDCGLVAGTLLGLRLAAFTGPWRWVG